jgi:hypothetical protein
MSHSYNFGSLIRLAFRRYSLNFILYPLSIPRIPITLAGALLSTFASLLLYLSATPLSFSSPQYYVSFLSTSAHPISALLFLFRLSPTISPLSLSHSYNCEMAFSLLSPYFSTMPIIHSFSPLITLRYLLFAPESLCYSLRGKYDRMLFSYG